MLVTEDELSFALAALSKNDITAALPKGTFCRVQKRLRSMLEDAVFGLPHEQKSVLVDAARLKRSKTSHDPDCMPMENIPVRTDQFQAGTANVGLSEDNRPGSLDELTVAWNELTIREITDLFPPKTFTYA